MLNLALKIIARALLCVIIVAAFVYSLTDTFPFALADSDKALHAVGYGVMTLIAIIAWPSHRRLVAVLAMALGLGVESLQIIVPSRSFSLDDLVANGLGIAAASVLAWCVKTYTARRRAIAEEARSIKSAWQDHP